MSTEAVPLVEQSSLAPRDEAVLEFERRWWQFGGAKESAIRAELDMSATQYYQILNSLLDLEAAVAHDPMLVKRLRRLRESRHRSRGTHPHPRVQR